MKHFRLGRSVSAFPVFQKQQKKWVLLSVDLGGPKFASLVVCETANVLDSRVVRCYSNQRVRSHNVWSQLPD